MIINGIFKPGDNVLLFDNYDYLFDRNREDWDKHPYKRRIPELYNNIFAKVIDISYMTYKATLMLPFRTRNGDCVIIKYIDIDMLYEINISSIHKFKPKPLFYGDHYSIAIDKRIYDNLYLNPTSSYRNVVFHTDMHDRENTMLNYIDSGYIHIPVTALHMVTRKFYERYNDSYNFEVFELYSDLYVIPRESVEQDIINMRYKHNQEIIGNNLTRVDKGEDNMEEKKLIVIHKDLKKIDKTNNARYECDKTKIQIEYNGGLIIGESIYTHNDRNPNTYSERQGVLEAIANAVCDGDFNKFFKQYLSDKKKEERETCRCPKCGILYDSIEDKDTCVAYHKANEKKRNLRYKARKAARIEEENKYLESEKNKYYKLNSDLDVKQPKNPNHKPKKTKKKSTSEK